MRLRHILVDFLVSFSSSSHFDYNRHDRQRSKVSIHGLHHRQLLFHPAANIFVPKLVCGIATSYLSMCENFKSVLWPLTPLGKGCEPCHSIIVF